jgi:hypothetical protein
MNAAAASAPVTSVPRPAAASTLGVTYRRDGYAIAPEPFPSPVIAEARTHLDALIATLPEGGRPEWLVEPHHRAPDWRWWLELCRTPSLLAQVADAMGCDELVLLMSHLIVKPAHDGMAIAWHQDMTYWPSVAGTAVCTVWLALDDVDEGNAPMRVIPRTHAERERLQRFDTDGTDLLRTRVEVTPEQVASARPVLLPAGGFSLHDAFLIHGSEANGSARRRAAYTMRYGDPAQVRVDHANHGKPVYYVLGDGRSLREDDIDLRAGKPLPATP